MGTVYQLIITLSILISQILGMNNVLGTENGWPWLLTITAIPAILQVASLPFCPESPKYLLLDKDDEMAAQSALSWLRGTIEVHDEMDEMKQEQESMKLVPKVTLKEMIINGSLRQPLIIAMMMMLAQQLSGINCAIFYSTDIFEKAGLNEQESQGATLGMGSMNVLMTVVSLFLIEKAGRKTLMLAGLSAMLVMTTLLLASLLTYVRLSHLEMTGFLIILISGNCTCNVLLGHRCCHPVRGGVRHRPRLHPLVLRDGALRPVWTSHRHLHRCHRQLVSKLPRRTCICASQCE